MKIHIVIWLRQSSKLTFHDTSSSFAHTLREKGHDVTLSSNFMPSRKNIIFGANDCIHTPHAVIEHIPKDSIIVNLEQLSGGSSVWSNETYLDVLRNHEVWDYSWANIEWLKEQNITNVKKISIGYSPSLEFVLPPPETKDIDVLFFGAVNERRSRIINALNMHPEINSVCSTSSSFGEERNKLIARSKIVINIHYYPSKILETVRLSHLVANKAYVISEGVINEDEMTVWKDIVFFTPYSSLVDTVAHHLKLTKGNRNKLANMKYERFKKYHEQRLPL